MVTALQVEQMSRVEKLQVMESIWADLSRIDADVESPAWHKGALSETQARVANGEEQAIDWEAAKRELRDAF